MNQEDMINCIIDGCHGIYLPQEFMKRIDRERWGITKEQADIILDGPDHEHYLDVWQEIIDDAEFEDEEGVWLLYQDQDLFMVHEDYDWSSMELA